MTDVVIVGSFVYDLITYTPQFPRPGETLRASNFSATCGGKGSNQAICAARLGASAAIVGLVGNDVFGAEAKKSLNRNNVNCDFLLTSKDESTGVATVSVLEETGENCIVVILGANMQVSKKHVEPAESLIASTKVLCCQFEIPTEASLEAMKIARKHGVTTVLNPAPGLPEFDRTLLQYADVICPNENETEFLTGIMPDSPESIQTALEKMLEFGTNIAIITRGEKGCVFATKDNRTAQYVEAPTVKAVDTVGAGDAFVGSMAYFLSKHPDLPLKEKIRRACAIASYSVQKSGSQSSYPRNVDLSPELFAD